MYWGEVGVIHVRWANLSSLSRNMYDRLFLSAILPRRSPSSCDTTSPTYSMINSPRNMRGRPWGLEGVVGWVRLVRGGVRGCVATLLRIHSRIH